MKSISLAFDVTALLDVLRWHGTCGKEYGHTSMGATMGFFAGILGITTCGVDNTGRSQWPTLPTPE